MIIRAKVWMVAACIIAAGICLLLGCSAPRAEERTVERFPDGREIITERRIIAPKDALAGSSMLTTTNGATELFLSGSQSKADLEKEKQDGETRRLPLWLGSVCLIVAGVMVVLPDHIISNMVAAGVAVPGGALIAISIAFKQLEHMLGVLVWVAGAGLVFGLVYIVIRTLSRKHLVT